MKFSTKIFSIILLISPFSVTFAQQKMSLKDALSIALNNNYSIKLSYNDQEINKNNVNYGNAGFLPTVTGNLTNTQRIETSSVNLSSGTTREAINAKTTNLNYGVSLNWRIFDGMQMFATYENLQNLNKQGELNAKRIVQQTIANVIAAYYVLVTAQKQLAATQTALEVSQIRLKNSKNRYTIGKGSKLELLAAKVDLNTDTTLLLRQEDLIRSNKIALNQLLARDLKIDFVLDEMIQIDELLNYESLKRSADAQNPSLQIAFLNQKIAEIEYKKVKGARYPSVSLNSGYNLSNATNPPTGFSLQSNSRGLNFGLTASLNIFNGFLQNRTEKNAQLDISSAKYQLAETKQNLDAQLLSAYQNYKTNLQLITLEKSNVAVAEENLKITLEKYKLGSIVPLELREAQRNFLDANVRYSDALFEAKIAEVALKEIAGNINI